MAKKPYVVVIGGANMDIAGRPAAKLVERDSNPGTIRMSHGGVGRNIAHNLALLGEDVRLVTAYGEDAQARELVVGCKAAGIDVSRSLTVPGGSTSTYLFVMDETGDMHVAINDMAILEELTHERMRERMELINGAAVVLVETNLPARTLRWLAANVKAPLFCDPISTIKACKIEGLLGSLHTLKPNLLEAEALSGLTAASSEGLDGVADALLESGLERAFISLGADGLLCADHASKKLLPLLPSRVVNTTGAGDAMMAALIWSYLHDLDLAEAGRAGLAASAIAVESSETVSPQMSERALLERMAR